MDLIMLKEENKIFKNLYNNLGWEIEKAIQRDDWKDTKEIISKGCPKDMSEKSFEKDSFFRSRLGNVAVAFWMLSEDTIALMCPKSFSDFTFEWLLHSKNKFNTTNIY